jgi:hypothetical protein
MGEAVNLPITAREFLEQAKASWNEDHAEQRLGQFLMNELWCFRPDLYGDTGAASIQVDPYYRDDLIPEFEEWLLENW